jgi:L-cystine transport system permease protein
MKLFDFAFFARNMPELLAHLPVTLFIALFSYAAAAVLGLTVALVKIYRVPVLKYFASAYISAIRGTPLLVQLFIICYGIPKAVYVFKTNYGIFTGYNPNAIAPIYYAIITFTINMGAYLSESIRAALEAVGVDQIEAAQSVGMTNRQLMMRIVIPQAFDIAVPIIGNGIISTVLETSFVFTIGIVDIMGQAKIIGARTTSYIEVYVGVALIYWAVCIILERIFSLIEKHTHRYKKNVAQEGL